MMTDPESLPLVPDDACSPVPVFNCQIILNTSESGQQIVGRVANLGGISVSGNTEREVLRRIAQIFRDQVQTLTEEKMPIPWIAPPEKARPGETERFVPIHL